MADDSAPGSFPPGGPTPPLATGLVYLRPAERNDVPLFVSWFNDRRTTRTLLMVSPMSEILEERWFDELLDHHGRDRWQSISATAARVSGS